MNLKGLGFQLKSLDRVFRAYIKIMKDKAFCRVEESLTLNQIFPEALDNIRHPYKSIEKKIETLTKRLDKVYGSVGGRKADQS